MVAAVWAGDWDEALRRLAHGRGRGVHLLRRVASAHTGGIASPVLLWLACSSRRSGGGRVLSSSKAPPRE